jgi:hypothetical protein
MEAARYPPLLDGFPTQAERGGGGSLRPTLSARLRGELLRPLSSHFSMSCATHLLSLLGHAELLQDLGPVLTDEARKPLACVLRAGERVRLALDSVSSILSGGDQGA